MLFLRALIAFLALPGIVAFLAPALLLGSIGTRTLAPWDPPRHLVSVGLYRFSRNPMYVGVLTILIGWTLAFRSGSLLIYTGVVALMFQLRVLLYEEPWLSRTFPDEWPRFKSRVPRWLFPGPRSDRP